MGRVLRGIGRCLWLLAVVLAVEAAHGDPTTNTVDITLPKAVVFFVTDADAATASSPATAQISFTDGDLMGGARLRISVQADATAFAAGGGTPIPASSVSWKVRGTAIGGTGYDGTLSAVTPTVVYLSKPSPKNGSVEFTWELGALPPEARAGAHTLGIRWILELVKE